ncbi:hypothetical protein SKAU_G00134950 [Synaphobranchus kaupii]|uniref:Uncharacterized protein n=1 Tax=Synaphobranchus kaupii TaxID=118154 RepID=A0A9Q1FRJ8_SYNKA|nr:hypothetical protein SKAU_G00134950 [Synaphobranchus kaupii]
MREDLRVMRQDTMREDLRVMRQDTMREDLRVMRRDTMREDLRVMRQDTMREDLRVMRRDTMREDLRVMRQDTMREDLRVMRQDTMREDLRVMRQDRGLQWGPLLRADAARCVVALQSYGVGLPRNVGHAIDNVPLHRAADVLLCHLPSGRSVISVSLITFPPGRLPAGSPRLMNGAGPQPGLPSPL